MKKIVFMLLITALLLLSVFSVSAAIDSGECGEHVTWELDEQGVLTISGSGPMDEFKSAPWRSYKTQIKSVVIQEGVTSIGKGAFSGLVINKITFPEKSLISVGSNAFSGSYIGSSVIFPDSVTTIGDMAFYQYLGKKVTLPKNLTSVSDYMFAYSEVTEVIVQDQVASFGVHAFYDCGNLESINFPESLTSIGYDCFWCCEKLTGELTIPEKVKKIEMSTFQGTGISAIHLTGAAEIGEFAFDSCSDLHTVTFSNQLNYIKESAFLGCDSLTELTIPKSVTLICDMGNHENLQRIYYLGTQEEWSNIRILGNLKQVEIIYKDDDAVSASLTTLAYEDNHLIGTVEIEGNAYPYTGILAVYDETGACVGMKTEEIPGRSGEYSITIPVEMDQDTSYTVKFMLWDVFDILRPIQRAIEQTYAIAA